MNFEDLPGGVYLLKVKFNDYGDLTYRLVKH